MTKFHKIFAQNCTRINILTPCLCKIVLSSYKDNNQFSNMRIVIVNLGLPNGSVELAFVWSGPVSSAPCWKIPTCLNQLKMQASETRSVDLMPLLSYRLHQTIDFKLIVFANFWCLSFSLVNNSLYTISNYVFPNFHHTSKSPAADFKPYYTGLFSWLSKFISTSLYH